VYVVVQQLWAVLMNYKHFHLIYLMRKGNILTHVDNRYLIVW